MSRLREVDYPNAPLVAFLMRTLNVPLYLRDDAYAEGLLALLEAEQKGTKGYGPSIVIKRRLIDFKRREGIGSHAKKAVAMMQPLAGFKESADSHQRIIFVARNRSVAIEKGEAA